MAPLLPAGTVLHMIGIHDNTSANRRNPDPNMWAGFGERSVDDMLQVWLDIVYLDDAEFKRLVDERKTNCKPRRRRSRPPDNVGRAFRPAAALLRGASGESPTAGRKACPTP